MFDQINAALVSRRFSESYQPQTFGCICLYNLQICDKQIDWACGWPL